MYLWRLRFTVWVIAMISVAPVVAQAECVRIGPQQHWTNPPDDHDSLLLFTGTVTNVAALTVTFNVDRVWSGKVRRQMTVLLVPGIEDLSPSFFRKGTAYFVEAHYTGSRATSGMGVPEGTPLYTISSCDDTGALALPQSQEWVRQLGPGRPPLR